MGKWNDIQLEKVSTVPKQLSVDSFITFKILLNLSSYMKTTKFNAIEKFNVMALFMNIFYKAVSYPLWFCKVPFYAFL